MLYLLDTGDVNHIKRAYDLYPLAGVTTNPTLIAREKADFLGMLTAIRGIIGAGTMLHVQAVSRTAEGIVGEASYLAEKIGGHLYIKIPVIAEGIKAIKLLKERGIKTTATAVFTPQQALMAAVAGADFVAPYVNRLDNICGDGARVVSDIVELFKTYNLPARVLAASFKNSEQVHQASLAGAHAVTVSPDILDLLLSHPLTDSSVDQFVKDWEGFYGAGKLTSHV
ncbi:MAG: fructose-6-phosphate aldolase [Negativicutes bacterium]|nr:fructose-6-phosphate aldolase [Negativicutes bacterium]